MPVSTRSNKEILVAPLAPPKRKYIKKSIEAVVEAVSEIRDDDHKDISNNSNLNLHLSIDEAPKTAFKRIKKSDFPNLK